MKSTNQGRGPTRDPRRWAATASTLALAALATACDGSLVSDRLIATDARASDGGLDPSRDARASSPDDASSATARGDGASSDLDGGPVLVGSDGGPVIGDPDGGVVVGRPDAASTGEWDVLETPPVLVDPIRIELPRDLGLWGPFEDTGYPCPGPMYFAEYPDDRDVLIVQTGDEPIRYPIHVNGGHHVRMVGVHIELERIPGCEALAGSNHPRVAGDRALAFQQTGITFVEGARIDVAGHDADCVTANNGSISPEDAREQRSFVLQNSRCDGNEGSNAGIHGDLFQTQHVGHYFHRIAFENVTHRTAQEGIIIDAYDGIHHVGEISVRRFDYAFDPRFVADDPHDAETGGMMAMMADAIHLEQIFCDGILGGCEGEAYISTDPSIHSGGWMHPPVVPMPHPAFTDGPAPVDFAPVDRVGRAYVSPHAGL